VLLSSLRPAWAALPGRTGMGVELDCPRHPFAASERPVVWFENPVDGGPPRDGVELANVLLDEPGAQVELERLTLLPTAGGCVRIGHWCGWVADGVLTEALIGGVAW
jgi:hypothetical protein